MLRNLLLSSVISIALIPATALAQGAPAPRNDNPVTTGQQIGTNDAGGHASSNDETDNKKQNDDLYKGGTAAGLKFDELDTNQDGKLDEDEFNQYRQSNGESDGTAGDQGKPLMQQFDHDGDGSVSREELEKGANRSEGTQ